MARFYETQQNATNLNIWLSQGSRLATATYFRYGGQNYNRFVGNLTGFPAVKNFENRLRFDEIIVTRGWRVSETQCIQPLSLIFIFNEKRPSNSVL